MNVYSLGVLLQTLKDDKEPTGTVRPAARVASVAAATAIGASQQRIPPALRGALLDVEELSGAPLPEAEARAAAVEDGTGRPPTGARPATAAIAAERALGPAAAAALAVAARLAPESVSIDISPTAALIDEALREEPQRAAATVHAAAPLVERGALAPQPLAAALQASIEQSGLFYESHLARWALQEFPQASLEHEPQASSRQDTALALAAAGGADNSDATMLPRVAGHDQPSPLVPQQLVRQQLSVLETGQLSWAGEVWPEQHADMHIREEASRDPAVAQATWRTSVTLDLPALGRIEFALTLQTNALRVRLQASDPAHATLLRAGTPFLRQALAGQAFALTGLDVTHESA